jgi:transcription elongation factor GreA
MASHYLTKEGLKELQDELNYLKKEGRRDIAERLKRAKEYGDLSENSEYSDAKEAQGKIETRIFELEEILRNNVIIKKDSGRSSVGIGSTVEVEKNGKSFRYTIVGSRESKPEASLISNESPLGKAFLGKKPGETVDVETPKGRAKYKILKIE